MRVQLTIRKGTKEDIPEMQKLFVETIQSVCANDYDQSQINVWISGARDAERWNNILNEQVVFITEIKDRIVGFSSIKNYNYIDLIYVDKDHQKQGVAYSLSNEMEDIAIQNKQRELTSDVSITAKPFFEKIGFQTIKKQTVLKENISLVNYKMVKKLMK